ncbi:hypothetical protein ACFQZC_30920 [Streptacidiphilus monticola]
MPWLHSLRHSLRAGLALQRQTNEPAAALRASVGVAVVLFGALAIGGPRLATSAALGAQMAGMATFQRSYRPRPFLALAAAAGLACAVFVGYLAAPHELGYLAVLGLWAFGAGMAWSMGPTAGIVASMTVAAMVVVVTLPVSIPRPPPMRASSPPGASSRPRWCSSCRSAAGDASATHWPTPTRRWRTTRGGSGTTRSPASTRTRSWSPARPPR